MNAKFLVQYYLCYCDSCHRFHLTTLTVFNTFQFKNFKITCGHSSIKSDWWKKVLQKPQNATLSTSERSNFSAISETSELFRLKFKNKINFLAIYHCKMWRSETISNAFCDMFLASSFLSTREAFIDVFASKTILLTVKIAYFLSRFRV